MKPVAVVIIDQQGVRIERLKENRHTLAEHLAEAVPKFLESMTHKEGDACGDRGAKRTLKPSFSCLFSSLNFDRLSDVIDMHRFYQLLIQAGIGEVCQYDKVSLADGTRGQGHDS